MLTSMQTRGSRQRFRGRRRGDAASRRWRPNGEGGEGVPEGRSYVRTTKGVGELQGFTTDLTAVTARLEGT
jgi:hypothetical protein